MFIDSHCHLNYLDDPSVALARAKAARVEGLLCIGVEQSSIGEVLAFAHADHIWASVGEHPGSCSGDAAWVKQYLTEPNVVAVGETGLDYHYEKDPDRRRQQIHTFEQQLELAAEFEYPVIVHTRAAQDDTLAAMRNFPDVRGVLHCFTESWEMAEQALALGYYISISGIVTFNSAANVREVAIQVPQERLLIETDSPWLAPVPHRGAQNEPAYVADTAAFIAQLRQWPLQELASSTTENFFRLFSKANTNAS